MIKKVCFGQTFFQRDEKVSARCETSKKVGIFFVLAFVGVQRYDRVQERKKQARGFLDDSLVLLVFMMLFTFYRLFFNLLYRLR